QSSLQGSLRFRSVLQLGYLTTPSSDCQALFSDFFREANRPSRTSFLSSKTCSPEPELFQTVCRGFIGF
ncbi:MAG: hypothetical protein LUG44_10340, partial [Clostridiales bacterium]|nr:hypothetical protein [Clostridiales bacterium]